MNNKEPMRFIRRNSRVFSAELKYPEDVERTTIDMNEFLSTLTDLGIRYKVTGRVTEHRLVFEVLM